MEIFDIRKDFLNNPMDFIIYFQRITSNISSEKMERGYKEFPTGWTEFNEQLVLVPGCVHKSSQ